MELVSPKLDVVFKTLFVENPDLLENFVACALDVNPEEITEFQITNPELPPESAEGKFSRLDISLVVNGRLVNIEIQVRKYPDYKDRSLFYWAKLFTSELKSGEEYGELKQTITINILDFNLFEERKQYYTEVLPLIKDSGELFSDKMSLRFYELKKVDKENNEGELELWLKFFNAASEEDFEMLQNTVTPAVKKAVNVIYNMSADDRIREQARLREKALHDEASALKGARNEGRMEGLLKGMWSLVNSGIISSAVAAQQCSMTEEAFLKTKPQAV